MPIGWIVSCWCLYKQGFVSLRSRRNQQQHQELHNNIHNNSSTAEQNMDAARRYPNPTSEQQDFKVAISSGHTLTVELLDGGVCLDDSDDDDDDIQVDRRRLQQAIEKAIHSISSTSTTTSSPITKLDLYASHFRANLTAKMIGSILQVLPPLEHLQLGGLRLSVEELCLVLGQPSLTGKLTHLALYDLEFTNNTRSIDQEGHHPPVATPLALQEVVAVFLRLESDQVTLDPLLETLERAPKLKQLELVLDHNHAYVHGYPRIDQQQQQPHQQLPPNNSQQQQQLFSAPAFANMLQATHESLSNIILEYVPLTAQHFEALAEYGNSVKQLRLRHDPSEASSESPSTMQALRAFLSPNNCPASLEQVSFDGILTQPQYATELCQVLACNKSIQSLRLRSLPLHLRDLTRLLSKNATLQHLALHNIDFESNSSGGDNNTTPLTIDPDPDVMEESVFATLVKILKDHNNTSLRRISWKQAEFKRTEVFPRLRKPKAYKCFQLKQKATQQHQAQQQLHWYLTLNQRGIRNMMADVSLPRSEFMNVLVHRKHPTLQKQHSQWPGQQPYTKSSNNVNEDELLDEYSLDCLYYLLSNNPSLCY